ncbi:MAG: FAD-binding dehydrogenase [Pseudomonadota bacterium]
MDCDVIVVGAGLAGLVAASELADAGKSVILVDQENEKNLGGQAFWSFGGLLFAGSPEQRRLGIRDNRDLLWQDWRGSAAFDREEDHWPKRWAEAYVDFAAGEKRPWLHELGVRFFPIVGWAERGGALAHGHGNSVPRFHIVWGTGPGLLAPFEKRVREAADNGRLEFCFRHQVDELILTNGRVSGVRGSLLEQSDKERGVQSSREVVGDFALSSDMVIVTSGGIGGNHKLVRKNWPRDRLGTPPKRLISGVPHHVDGRMLDITKRAGGDVINADRMWHYTEGIKNWDPIWPKHGIRILPGPSSFWCDAEGYRMPVPCLPGYDTLSTLGHIMQSGYDYSWFVLNQSIIEKEFALSGSEQNPDLTGKSILKVLQRVKKGAPPPVEAFKQKGEDFIVRDRIEDLVDGMNALTGTDLIRLGHLRNQIEARDREIDNAYTKDLQIAALRVARNYIGDRLIRSAKPHRILDPKHGPLIAVRLNILTRKSLGGIHTDLCARVLQQSGDVVEGLYAAGEAAGFGGGGMHGYNALEGTFLGGCIFSGRVAGREAAKSA